MTIDCTLSNLAVPGFPDLTPEFGTKKADGEPITARENNRNVMLPFTRQRPFLVTENSETSLIEAHTSFVMQIADVSLTLGSGAFIGCRARVFNLSSGEVKVIFGEGEDAIATLAVEEDLILEWRGADWRIAASGGGGVSISTDTPDGWGAYIEGRNLMTVLGKESVADTIAEVQRLCNNNGEIDDTGVPFFSGLQIGDYIDGIDLSAIAAENSGTAGQAWNDAYKNNRIVIAGFNTYKGAGDTENTKNHVLFVFRNIPIKKRMNSSNTNTGGYQASELRAFLEGLNGNGTGDMSGVTTARFLNVLKQQIGDVLYTIRKLHSTKGSATWSNYTVFPPTEIEVFGFQTYGDELAQNNTNVQFPIYQKSYEYRIKRYNGARDWWWEHTPYLSAATYFCDVHSLGNANSNNASSVGGCAPAFCVA